MVGPPFREPQNEQRYLIRSLIWKQVRLGLERLGLSSEERRVRNSQNMDLLTAHTHSQCAASWMISESIKGIFFKPGQMFIYFMSKLFIHHQFTSLAQLEAVTWQQTSHKLPLKWETPARFTLLPLALFSRCVSSHRAQAEITLMTSSQLFLPTWQSLSTVTEHIRKLFSQPELHSF